jgi:nucleotide-binding universal stress UspA family protein
MLVNFRAQVPARTVARPWRLTGINRRRPPPRDAVAVAPPVPAVYTCILLATDGSTAARHATDMAIALAARLGARVHALYVLAPQPAVDFVADAIQGAPHARRATRQADRELAEVRRKAGRAGVPCEVERVFDRRPHAAIASAASGLHCDLVVMGAHGHGGPPPGDVTRQVMLNCDVPVLVCR